jgi:hypothetical protein
VAFWPPGLAHGLGTAETADSGANRSIRVPKARPGAVGDGFKALVQAVEEGRREPPTQAELLQRTGMAQQALSRDFRLLREIILEFDLENPIKIQK